MKKIILLIILLTASFMFCTTLFAVPNSCAGTQPTITSNTTTNNITGTTTTATNFLYESFANTSLSISYGTHEVDYNDIRDCANYYGMIVNKKEGPIMQTTVSNGTIIVKELPSGNTISSTPALIYSNSIRIGTTYLSPSETYDWKYALYFYSWLSGADVKEKTSSNSTVNDFIALSYLQTRDPFRSLNSYIKCQYKYQYDQDVQKTTNFYCTN